MDAAARLGFERLDLQVRACVFTMIDFGVVRLSALSASSDLAISRRDRRILELALAKLHGARVDFNEAIGALREATEEVIPDGRVFRLGAADTAPIVGSIVSGVGIVECASGIRLVRVHGSGDFSQIGWFSR